MKSIILLFAVLFTIPGLFAQNVDKIYTIGNQTISCTITKIDKKNITYRIESEDDKFLSAEIPFKEVEKIESDNPVITAKFNEIKTELDVPASEDIKRATLMIASGIGLTVAGIGVMALSNAPGIFQHKRGQFLATGQAMTITGLALGGFGFYQLKKAKTKE